MSPPKTWEEERSGVMERLNTLKERADKLSVDFKSGDAKVDAALVEIRGVVAELKTTVTSELVAMKWRIILVAALSGAGVSGIAQLIAIMGGG